MNARPARAAGFSLLELVVVIVLMSVLLGVAIERMLLMKARAESSSMDQVVGTLRSAITIRVAELMAKGRANEVARLIGANPMERLAEQPSNYLGELYGPDPFSLAAGNWYFDSRDRALCYLVENRDYFRSPSESARACFRIQPVFQDVNRNGRFDPGVDELGGLRLAPLLPYSWHLQFLWPAWPGSSPEAAQP